MTTEETLTSSTVDLKSRDDDQMSEGITEEIGQVDSPASADGAAVTKPRRKRWRRLRQFWRVGAGVWVGLLLVAGGFGLIAYTWSQTAALLDVALQIPFLVSGGLTGLGLILVGLLVVNLSVKRKEALDRQRQLDEVREALIRLQAAIEGDKES